MNLTTPLMALSLLLSISEALTILLSISEALHFPLSISEMSETHISFILIKIFSLSPQSFSFDLFCFYCISSSITLTDLNQFILV